MMRIRFQLPYVILGKSLINEHVYFHLHNVFSVDIFETTDIIFKIQDYAYSATIRVLLSYNTFHKQF